ncbi:MAG: chitobiase/beta-hexosaminidase C-terminal domain-containing protein [Planctomycetes bacterium]|nr:chitobiase/beta-hexosaminidase C-terminal domain-containing protein [Planctomycetota bacterium]
MFRNILALLIFLASCAFGSERTVCDSERSMIFGDASGDAYQALGANVDVVVSPDFPRQSPDAIKVSHGRFHVFNADDDSTWVYFPYAHLKRYEQKEIAAGRPPIFVTATYQGKKRPVLWSWSLGFVAAGQVPTMPASYWKQAVNLADDRFIKFWIHEYAYPKLLSRFVDLPNMWIGCDECAYMYGLYGVLDDDGRWVPGIPWDPPFQQDNAQYQDSITTFFRRVREIAPNLDIMCNDGGIEVNTMTSSLDAFKNIYSVSASGIMQEDGFYFYPYTDAWGRGEFQKLTEKYQWLGATGKVLIAMYTFQQDLSYTERLRAAYGHYLIFRGDNFFFSPQFTDSPAQPECPPADYAEMRDQLGLPIAPAGSESASGDGFRLYWRRCQGGLVCLNWTGTTRTISLPTGSWHLPGGTTPVQSLVLADRNAAYVTSSPGRTAPRPRIAPRMAAAITGPVSVTLASEAVGGTIRYTTDGSDPTAASPAYVGPISVSASMVVIARTYVAGSNPSHSNRATYTVVATLPTAQFHLAADGGSEHLAHHYPVVRLDHPSATIIRIDYAATGGTATGDGVDAMVIPGTLTFQPGETSKYLPIAIVDDATPENSETIIITLANARGAALGAQTTFTYAITDDDGGSSPVPPVISSIGTASATVGQSFIYAITASNVPTSFGAIGLPAGVTLNASTGVISGTPTTAGTTTATVSATNAGGTGSKTVIITVDPAVPAVTVRVIALTPSTGNGSSAMFTATISDTAGSSDIALVNILVNDILYSMNACAVTYTASTGTLSLSNDDFLSGSTQGSIGSSSVLSNSQCSIDLSKVTVTSNGADLTLRLPISFTARFVGEKNTYVRAASATGVVAHFAQMGTWTVTSTVDATAPVISAVVASRITARSATVTWTTTEASDSQVHYGRTTSYGSVSALDPSLVTSHSVTLSGLARKTTYHYRVLSRDAAGNLATTTDGYLIGKSGLDPASAAPIGDLTFTTGDDDGGGDPRCGFGSSIALLALASLLMARHRRAETPIDDC